MREKVFKTVVGLDLMFVLSTAVRPGECCNTVSAKHYADAKKDDLSEMPGFLSGGLTILVCSEAIRLGKCFSCACLPILFGGMA